MKGINVIKAEQLKTWGNIRQTQDGWMLARPYGMGGIKRRLKLAWKVFKGEADVLVWHKQ